MLVRELQFPKEATPMFVTLLGMVILFKELQLSNA
jgi:hypothetical protein